MRTGAHGSFACVALLVALASIAAPASAQTKSLKDQLIGHWQLVSVTIGETTPYGDKPQGSMFFDAAGHFSVIVITNGRARNIAYYGTYTVDEAGHSMMLHLEGSTQPSRAGPDLKRLITFNGKELVTTSEKALGPIGNVQLTWTPAD